MMELMTIVLMCWFLAILVGVPIHLSMALAGIGFVWFANIPLIIVPQKIAMSANSFPLVAAPFFIFMANVMNFSGVTTRMFRFATVLVGWMRGGCQANIVASVIFADMSGSAVADAGGLGTLEIKAMRDAGYPPDLAGAVTAASATIGPILPPSLPMIIYGVTAETSIGALFLGAIIPGLMMAGAMMAMVRLITAGMDLPEHAFPTLCDIWVSFRQAIWALLTPVVLLAGIFAGIFTPTEAAVVASAYALFVGGVIYRDFSVRELPEVIVRTVQTTGVVMALVMIAALMAWVLSVARMPQVVGSALAGLSDNPLIILLIVNAALIVVGLFMEAIAAMLILIPIFVPIAISAGIDPVQFGIIFVLNLMIGTITPPVGIVLFVTAKIADISFERLTRATLPFLLPLVVVLVIITLVPEVTTLLPRLLLGYK